MIFFVKFIILLLKTLVRTYLRQFCEYSPSSFYYSSGMSNSLSIHLVFFGIQCIGQLNGQNIHFLQTLSIPIGPLINPIIQAFNLKLDNRLQPKFINRELKAINIVIKDLLLGPVTRQQEFGCFWLAPRTCSHGKLVTDDPINISLNDFMCQVL